jgi:pimeloyl-ACP methyl ester carboxylesterase
MRLPTTLAGTGDTDRRVALVTIAMVLIGCAPTWTSAPDPAARLQSATALAEAGGFERLDLSSEAFARPYLAAWARPGSVAGCVRVYLEGDGLSWASRRQPSPDPTPVDPVGLRLALADSSEATLVYLGRPCQYTGTEDSSCRPILWTAGRYGEDALSAMNSGLDAALDQIASSVDDLTLVGFSGGGVMAALLTARREDIDRLVTIAAPLDVDHWTREMQVSPLVLSGSPMWNVDLLRLVEQDHFIGLNDDRVPVSATQRFHAALGPQAPSRMHPIEDLGHRDWPKRWNELLSTVSGLCGE